MVKTYGPMMSMDASGSLASAVTFSKWKGRNYVRQLVIPSNPQSGGQTGMRAMLRFLSQRWYGLTVGNKATWDTLAKAANVSPFNSYIGKNQRRWRSFKCPSIEYPAAEAAAAPSAPTTTVTGGIHQIQLSIADGATPPTGGWVIHAFTVTGFTPAYSNVIAVIPKTATPTIYIHAPLQPAVWFYRVMGFASDGKAGAVEAQTTGTAT
jgi:hypothetical protein